MPESMQRSSLVEIYNVVNTFQCFHKYKYTFKTCSRVDPGIINSHYLKMLFGLPWLSLPCPYLLQPLSLWLPRLHIASASNREGLELLRLRFNISEVIDNKMVTPNPWKLMDKAHMKNKEGGVQIRECRMSWGCERLRSLSNWGYWWCKPTNRKVKRRGAEQHYQREDKELEHGGHLTKGDEEKTDVFGDAHFLSDCFWFVSEDSAFVVEHIAFWSYKKTRVLMIIPAKEKSHSTWSMVILKERMLTSNNFW